MDELRHEQDMQRLMDACGAELERRVGFAAGNVFFHFQRFVSAITDVDVRLAVQWHETMMGVEP